MLHSTTMLKLRILPKVVIHPRWHSLVVFLVLSTWTPFARVSGLNDDIDMSDSDAIARRILGEGNYHLSLTQKPEDLGSGESEDFFLESVGVATNITNKDQPTKLPHWTLTTKLSTTSIMEILDERVTDVTATVSPADLSVTIEGDSDFIPLTAETVVTSPPKTKSKSTPFTSEQIREKATSKFSQPTTILNVSENVFRMHETSSASSKIQVPRNKLPIVEIQDGATSTKVMRTSNPTSAVTFVEEGFIPVSSKATSSSTPEDSKTEDIWETATGTKVTTTTFRTMTSSKTTQSDSILSTTEVTSASTPAAAKTTPTMIEIQEHTSNTKTKAIPTTEFLTIERDDGFIPVTVEKTSKQNTHSVTVPIVAPTNKVSQLALLPEEYSKTTTFSKSTATDRNLQTGSGDFQQQTTSMELTASSQRATNQPTKFPDWTSTTKPSTTSIMEVLDERVTDVTATVSPADLAVTIEGDSDFIPVTAETVVTSQPKTKSKSTPFTSEQIRDKATSKLSQSTTILNFDENVFRMHETSSASSQIKVPRNTSPIVEIQDDVTSTKAMGTSNPTSAVTFVEEEGFIPESSKATSSSTPEAPITEDVWETATGTKVTTTTLRTMASSKTTQSDSILPTTEAISASTPAAAKTTPTMIEILEHTSDTRTREIPTTKFVTVESDDGFIPVTVEKTNNQNTHSVAAPIVAPTNMVSQLALLQEENSETTTSVFSKSSETTDQNIQTGSVDLMKGSTQNARKLELERTTIFKEVPETSFEKSTRTVTLASEVPYPSTPMEMQTSIITPSTLVFPDHERGDLTSPVIPSVRVERTTSGITTNTTKKGKFLTSSSAILTTAGGGSSLSPSPRHSLPFDIVPFPVAVIVGSTHIPRCGKMKLSALNSRDTLGGGLSYDWSVASKGDTEAIEEAMEFYKVTEAGLSVPVLALNGSLMTDFDTVYTFNLTVTNTLGMSDSTTVDVMRSSGALFEVMISSNVDEKAIQLSESVRLRAEVNFYSDCMAIADVRYNWTCDDSAMTVISELIYLVLPPYTLTVNKTMTCSVTVSDAIDSSRNNTAYVKLRSIPSDPVAIIEGGTEMDIGVQNGIVHLDGGSSYDSDSKDSDQLRYMWTCHQKIDNTPCISSATGITFPDIADATSPILEFDSSHMAIDKTYRFTLNVTAGTRSSEAFVDVNAKAGQLPKISMDIPGKDGKVTSSETVQLKATISHTSSLLSVVWHTMPGPGYTTLNLTNTENLQAPIEITQAGSDFKTISRIFIKPGKLEPGKKYKFSVTAVTDDNASATASTMVTVWRDVSGCQLRVQDYVELDEVDFDVVGCTADSDAHPLSFEVLLAGTEEQSQTETVVTKTTSATGTFVGRPSLNGKNLYMLKVYDQHGSYMETHTEVTVTTKTSFSAAEIQRYLRKSVMAYESKGDYLSALGNYNAFVRKISSPRSSKRRRRESSSDVIEKTLKQLYYAKMAAKNVYLDNSLAESIIEQMNYIDVTLLDDINKVEFAATLKNVLDVITSEGASLVISPSNIQSVLLKLPDLHVSRDQKQLETISSIQQALLTEMSFQVQPYEDRAIYSNGEAVFTVKNMLPCGTVELSSDNRSSTIDFGEQLCKNYGPSWSSDDEGKTSHYGVVLKSIRYNVGAKHLTSKSDDATTFASNILEITLANPETGQNIRIHHLSSPISISMPLISAIAQENVNYVCKFWNEDTSGWSSNGIESVMHPSKNYIVCKSTHFSVFTIITEGINIGLSMNTSLEQSERRDTGVSHASRSAVKHDKKLVLIICLSLVGINALVLVCTCTIFYFKRRSATQSHTKRDEDVVSRLSTESNSFDCENIPEYQLPRTVEVTIATVHEVSDDKNRPSSAVYV